MPPSPVPLAGPSPQTASPPVAAAILGREGNRGWRAPSRPRPHARCCGPSLPDGGVYQVSQSRRVLTLPLAKEARACPPPAGICLGRGGWKRGASPTRMLKARGLEWWLLEQARMDWFMGEVAELVKAGMHRRDKSRLQFIPSLQSQFSANTESFSLLFPYSYSRFVTAKLDLQAFPSSFF